MVGWPTKWVVGREWDSGRTSGVEMSQFVSPSPLYFQSFCLRMLRYRRFGISLVMGMVGPLFSQWHFMIGRSRGWSISCIRSKPSGCKGRRKIRVFWTASKCGVFSVKSLYSILEPDVSPLFSNGSIWRVSVPPKVAFFAWEASWGKVLESS